jgi:hypothetical protein
LVAAGRGRLDERPRAHTAATYQRAGSRLWLSMRDLQPPTDDRAPAGDDALLDALRGVLQTADPTPERVLDAGRMAYGARELAALPVTPAARW